MPSSPIRKLVPYSDDAKARGLHVFHLNIGQPDILTPEVALAAIKNAKIPIVEYTNSAGMPEYRRKLSRYYQSVGINLSPDQMLVTCGGSEAVLFAFMSCLDPLDEIIVPEPFYANYEAFAAAAGAWADERQDAHYGLHYQQDNGQRRVEHTLAVLAVGTHEEVSHKQDYYHCEQRQFLAHIQKL